MLPKLIPKIVERSFRYLDGYTETQIKTLHACSLSIAIVSVISGIIGITVWVRMDATKRMVFRLQIFIALIIWDFAKALCFLCFNAIRLAHLKALLVTYAFDDHGFCDGWGFIINVTTFASDVTILCLTVHNAWVIFYPQSINLYNRRVICYRVIGHNLLDFLKFKKFPTSMSAIFFEKNNKRILINEGGIFPYRWFLAFFLTALSFVVSGLAFVDSGHYRSNYICSLPHSPVWKRLIGSTIIKYTNLLTITVVYVSLILYLMMKFRQLRKEKEKVYKERMKHHSLTGNEADSPTAIVNQLIYGSFQKELMDLTTNESEKKIKQAMRDLKSYIIYPLGYVLIWIAPTIAQILDYRHSNNFSDPYALRIFMALSLPFSCTIYTITFLVIERPWELSTSNLKKRGLFCIDDADSIVHNDPRYGLHSNSIGGSATSTIINPRATAYNNKANIDGSNQQRNEQNTLEETSKKIRYKSRHSSNASSSTKSSILRTLIGSRRPSAIPQLDTPFEETYSDSIDEADEMDLLDFLRNGPQNVHMKESV